LSSYTEGLAPESWHLVPFVLNWGSAGAEKTMTSHVSQETPSPLERWLSKVGLSEGNPFGVNEADREPFVPECFVDPGVYDTVKNDPHTTLVFAPRGGGKTALRVMLASDCRPIQPLAASPRSQTLAVTYSDFDPALKACDYDLARLTAGHHVDKILRACLKNPMGWQPGDAPGV